MYQGERQEKVSTALEKLYYRHIVTTEIKEVPTTNLDIFMHMTIQAGGNYQHLTSSRQFV
jgi:hypothetical protein